MNAAQSFEFTGDFSKENFEYVMKELLRLRRQRTEDLIKIGEQKTRIISLQKELIELYGESFRPSALRIVR